jgi:hypothetical protein
MERAEVLNMMGALKLYGMKAAYDETLAVALKRGMSRSALSATCSKPGSRKSSRARSNISSPSPACRSPRTSTTSPSRTRPSTRLWSATSPRAPSPPSSATPC